MNRLIILLLVIVVANSCATITQVSTLTDSKMNNLLGKKVQIEGVATNAKLGALLKTNNSFIWIDGMRSWPKGYYYGGNDGKKLKITGTVIEKYDLPIFIQKEDGLLNSGIPIPEGTDLKEVSHRYLLKNAKWEIITD